MNGLPSSAVVADALNLSLKRQGNLLQTPFYDSAIRGQNNELVAANNVEHPVLGASGQWVSSTTGAPWHGAYKDANGSQTYFSNGSKVADISMVGQQKPDFQVTRTAKNPLISSSIDAAFTRGNQTGAVLTKNFNDYLAEARRVGQEGKAQLAADQQSINPDGTISRMNADAASAAADLQGQNRNYAAEQQTVLGKVADRNNAYQSDQSKRIADLSAKLDSQQSDYEKSTQALAQQAYEKAQRQISLYHLGTGTPTSGSGNLDNRYMRAYADINVPLQADLANRRIAQTNQIYGLESGLEGQDYQNRMSQYAGESALNTDLVNRNSDTTRYLTGLDQNTAQYIQQLRQATAGMSRAMAAQYLEQLRVPIQIGQQILGADTQNLSALQALDERANAYTFTTPYQSSRLPSVSSFGLTVPNRSYTGNSGGGGSGGGDFTSNVLGDYNDLGASQSAWLQTPAGKAWAANKAPTTATSSAPGDYRYGPNGDLKLTGQGRYQDAYGNNYEMRPNGELVNVGQPG